MARPYRFGNHARDDFATVVENGTVEIDVLANDRGGKGAKTIWSFDQFDPSLFSDFFEFPGGSTVGLRGGANIALYKTVDKFDYLAEGEIAYETFTYAMRLGNGKISVATVTVKIIGVNDPASLSKASVQLTEGDSAADISTSGKLKIFDVDGPESFAAGSQAGLYGTLTLAEDGNWTYQADGAHDEFVDGKTYRDKFTVAAADGTTTTIEIVIVGSAEGGSTGPITIEGTDLDDTLTGGAGAEILIGKAGKDLLEGGGGADVLRGGGGGDTLRGGGGDDDLHGGAGYDSLLGGDGRDRFFFDVALGAGNADKIGDFVAADDSFMLDRSVFAALPADAVLPKSAFNIGAAAIEAADRIIYDYDSGNLFYDPDGTGPAAQILFAKVDAGTWITNDDFIAF